MGLNKDGPRRYRHAGDLTDEPPTREVNTFDLKFRNIVY